MFDAQASSDGNGEDPCDLEIQHSLGSLAIGQISAPGARGNVSFPYQCTYSVDIRVSFRGWGGGGDWN